MPDPHVTVPDEDTRKKYTVGSTPQDTFTIDCTFYSNADIKVYNGDTLLSSADYTVNGNSGTLGGYEGGEVVLDTPVSNTTITVLLDIAYERTTDFPTSADFKITSLNTQFDKIFSLFQQVNEKISRALTLKNTTSLTSISFIEDPEDGTFPIYSTADGGFINGANVADISEAQTYAADALASKDAALVAQAAAESAKSAAEAAASGMKWRPTVKLATTANDSLSGLASRDGVTPVAGNRILVRANTTTSQNGVYIAAAGAWTRATDADSWDELIGQVVVVEEGSTYADQAFICTVNSGGTLGSTAVTWASFNPPLQDGAVSTAAKIVDGIITYAKILSSEFATTAEIISGAASKFVNAVNLAPLFYGCSLYQSTGTTAPITTWTTIGWDSESYKDVAGWHNNSTNNSRITVDFTGRINLIATVDFGTAANAIYGIRLLKNGSVVLTGPNESSSSFAGTAVKQITADLSCSSGDYFEVQIYSNNASITTATGATKTTFTARRIK